MKNAVTKHILLGLFLFLLWAPLLQSKLQVFRGGGLKGAFEKPEDIKLNTNNWFDGSFAVKKEAFAKCDFGFQGDLVRVYNQFDYSVFKIAHSPGVIIGKDDYIYEQRYIDAYYGKDFVGDDAIKPRVAAIKELQDTLQNHGIFLFTVFAPGKGAFYPEYIPDNKKMPLGRTNYQACIDAYKNSGLNYIDFAAYFKAAKDTSRYRLYSHGGIHWTYYGDVLVFDSIVHYLRQKSGYQMPGFFVGDIKLSTVPRYRDNDATDALNLITLFNKDTLAYPSDTAYDKKRNLNFMTLGDSYYWNIQLYMAALEFKNGAFWYYFANIYNTGAPTIGKEEAQPRLKEILLKQNVICIMQTDAGLGSLGMGLPEQANAMFKK